jgi:hypothetical protein
MVLADLVSACSSCSPRRRSALAVFMTGYVPTTNARSSDRARHRPLVSCNPVVAALLGVVLFTGTMRLSGIGSSRTTGCRGAAAATAVPLTSSRLRPN